jgi:DNA-directed RNA polymerase specialized sigma24 family protein
MTTTTTIHPKRTSLTARKKEENSFIERVVSQYGDLVFDLCHSVLWSQANAQIAFRAILRELRRRRADNSFIEHERAWVLRITAIKLEVMAQRYGKKLTPSEQIMLDASLNSEERLKQFDSYFHRLPTTDQILLILRDKYGIPYTDIAAALKLPEESLKIRRQQSLRTLEDWLWNNT